MEPSANRPMVTVGATPMSKYGQKLKSFRKVVRTSFLNKNGRYGILATLVFESFSVKCFLN